jgi:hypothetical protein
MIHQPIQKGIQFRTEIISFGRVRFSGDCESALNFAETGTGETMNMIRVIGFRQTAHRSPKPAAFPPRIGGF